MVKNLPAMRETWVLSLGWEDPQEEETATHPSILAWRIPMDRGAWWVTVHVTVGHDWVTKHEGKLLTHTYPPKHLKKLSDVTEWKFTGVLSHYSGCSGFIQGFCKHAWSKDSITVSVNDLGFLNCLLEILIWSVWVDPMNLYFWEVAG